VPTHIRHLASWLSGGAHPQLEVGTTGHQPSLTDSILPLLQASEGDAAAVKPVPLDVHLPQPMLHPHAAASPPVSGAPKRLTRQPSTWPRASVTGVPQVQRSHRTQVEELPSGGVTALPSRAAHPSADGAATIAGDPLIVTGAPRRAPDAKPQPKSKAKPTPKPLAVSHRTDPEQSQLDPDVAIVSIHSGSVRPRRLELCCSLTLPSPCSH
jgi:hypothetical protein